MGARDQDRGITAGEQLQSGGLNAHIILIERNFTSEEKSLTNPQPSHT